MRNRFDIRSQPGFGVIAIFTFFALYLPIAALVVYSFNSSRLNQRAACNSSLIWMACIGA